MQKPGFKKDRGAQTERPEFDQFILDLARVTRVTKGGKHLSFRACVVLGDRHGRVGFGVAKGKDVQLGVEKAVHQAKKHIIRVPIIKETIPHPVVQKFKAASILLKPAPKGSGIIAGGAARTVLEMAGVPNVSAKLLGKTKNKIAVVKATFEALESFKKGGRTEVVKVEEVKPIEVDTGDDKIAPKKVATRTVRAKKETKEKNNCIFMLHEHTIRPARGAKHSPKRVGRGNASGHGTSSTRGGKGQTARSGGSRGLQLKGFRTQLLATPKLRGFKSGIQKPAEVELFKLEKHFSSGDTVTLALLKEKNIISATAKAAKVLNTGTLTKKLILEGVTGTAGALEKVKAAGGEVK